MWQKKIFTCGIIILLCFSIVASGSVDLWAQTLVHLGTILLLFFYFLLSFQNKEFTLSRIPPILGFFLCSLFISYFFSYSKFTSRSELLNWLNYFVFFSFASILSKEKKIFCWGIIGLAFFLTFWGFFDLILHPGNPLKSSLINPNIFAGYLILAISLLIGQITNYNLGIRKNRWQLLIGSILLLALILTGSLGAIVSLSIVLILYSKQLPIQRKIRVLSLILVIIFTTLFILRYFQPGISDRLNWWRGAIEMFFARPLTGIGLGNFARYYPQFGTRGLNSLYAHNYYLEMLGETGIISSVFFIGFLIYFIYRKEKNLGIAMAITSILIHNLIDYNLAIPGIALSFWILLGLEINPDKFKISLERKFYLLVIITILFLLFSFFIFRLFLANRAYARGLYYFRSEKNLLLSEKELNYSLTLDREYTPTYQVLSTVYTEYFFRNNSASYLRQALNFIDQAIKKENKYAPYWLDKAWIYYLLEEKEIARKTLQEAKKLNMPFDFTFNLEKMLK